MLTVKKYHIPGEEQELKQPPIKWQMKYDTSHDVRFESMRNPMRHGQLQRIHQDLTKETERKIRAYERGQRIFTADIRRHSLKLQNRMSALRNITNSVNSMLSVKYSYHSWQKSDSDEMEEIIKTSDSTDKKGDDRTLLFRITRREGEVKIPSKKGLSRYQSAMPASAKTLPVQTLVVHKEFTI